MSVVVYRDWLARRSEPPLTGVEGLEQQVVMGSAVGLDLAEIAPFVRSLRAVFVGQVILIVDREPTLLAWLTTHGVETIIAPDRPRWKAHPTVARFAVFAELLRDRREIHEAVLADVRDVVFQTDPFRLATEDLEFFTGAGGATPGPGEQRAMAAIIGDSLAGDLGRRGRIADVIAGPRERVVRFCRSVLLLCSAPRTGVGAGLDRAACHVVAHLGLAGGEISRNFQRVAVASCGMRIADGRVLNPDDTSSPIVVGYRRCADIALHLDGRWGVPPGSWTGAGLRRALRTIQTTVLGGVPV